MDVLATLMSDMKDAMRSHDQVALNTVRFLMAEVKNAQIDKPGHEPLTENEFVAIVKKVVKNTEEAMLQYGEGGREDLVEAEKPRIAFMQKYLPKQMNEAELRQVITDIRAANPGVAAGPLTGMVMKQVGGAADGGLVSKLIRETELH